MVEFCDVEDYCLGILGKEEGEGNVIEREGGKQYEEEFEEVLVDEQEDRKVVEERGGGVDVGVVEAEE